MNKHIIKSKQANNSNLGHSTILNLKDFNQYKKIPYFLQFMIDRRFAKEEVYKTAHEGKYVLNDLHQYLMKDIRGFNHSLTNYELELAAWSIIIDSGALQKLRKISGEKLWRKIYKLYRKRDTPLDEFKYYRKFENIKKDVKTKILNSLHHDRWNNEKRYKYGQSVCSLI